MASRNGTQQFGVLAFWAFINLLLLGCGTSFKSSDTSPRESRAMAVNGLQALNQPSMQFQFQNLSNGDCVAGSITIAVNADGTGHGDVVTWTNSTHSGDYWRLNLQFKNAGGVVVASASNVNQAAVFTEVVHEFPFTNRFIYWQFSSPKMDDTDANGNKSPHYGWSFDFTIDKGQFGNIATCTADYKC
jgi:hypothetical protein